MFCPFFTGSKGIFMKVILYQPQIPQNTGNIVRTCAVTGCDLMLVGPLGFSIADRWLKRSGLDYWEKVHVEVIEGLAPFLSLLEEAPGKIHLLSSKATVAYTTVTYGPKDWLIFGSETSGLPQEIMERWRDCAVRIPMVPEARCLNLATSAGIVIYEAWRQQGFA
jgi:tRNA (cytidine/uridine-2'-O-)-methyltransferase